jgi:hypothetical protein
MRKTICKKFLANNFFGNFCGNCFNRASSKVGIVTASSNYFVIATVAKKLFLPVRSLPLQRHKKVLDTHCYNIGLKNSNGYFVTAAYRQTRARLIPTSTPEQRSVEHYNFTKTKVFNLEI